MKTKRIFFKIMALLVSILMLFTSIPLNVLAYYKEKNNGISIKDKNGNTIMTNSSWETKFPYGTFAFSTSELTVNEGGEGKITVYRLGGTKGRATAVINYVPAITDIAEGVKSYSNAAGSSDISIRVEDPLPIAKYQTIGKDPDPIKPSPAVGITTGKIDEKGDLHLKLGTEAESYQWYIFADNAWKVVTGATDNEFTISNDDYLKYDIRCVFTIKGIAYCSDSLKGMAYENAKQEVLGTPPADIDLNPPTTYSVVPMDNPDKYAGYAFTVTFAEDEWVKDIYVSSKDNTKSQPDKFGTFTIVGCEGGSLYDAANTLMLRVKENEAPTASQIGFEVKSVTVDKASGTAILIVKRTGGNQTVLSVDYSTTDGTAVAGRDYGSSSGTLNFYSDIDEQTIKIPLINDGKATNEKISFTVTISNLKGDTNKICSLTDTTATVYLYNTAVESKKNLSTMLYDEDVIDATGNTLEASDSLAPTKLATVGGTEIKNKKNSPSATIVYPDKDDKNGEIKAFTYNYALGSISFSNPINRWMDRTYIANKSNQSNGDTLSGLYKSGWTGGSADGNGWKIESKGNSSGDLTIPYGSAMYSRFYGTFSWNASLASDEDIFFYGLEYVYPYFQVLKSSGEQYAYVNANHSTSGNWWDGYTLRWYTSGSIDSSWNVGDNVGKLRLGTQRYDAHNGKSNALAALNDGYLVRRKFDNKFGLRIYTANDSDSSPSGSAQLTEASGVYKSIQPTVSIVNGSGGVDGSGKLYVGSTIQVELKSTASYKPATEDSTLDYGVYLTDSSGKIVATGKKEAGSNKYNINMIWDGFTQSSLTDTYTINVVMTRSQEFKIDIRPSVQRLKDVDGNVLNSIDTGKITETIDKFKSHGSSFITIGYSETDKNSGNRFTYKQKNINKSDLTGTDTSGVIKYPSNIENIQWINFNLPSDDIVILDGKSFYGNEKIYLEMRNLSTASLDFRYYEKNYITAANDMTTSISQTGLYLDKNGNGRIDGYFNMQTGYFILDKDNKGDDIDEFIYFLNKDTDYDESVFAPVPMYDSKGQIVGYRQYFLKAFYTMTPRSLVAPAGANSNDYAQVIPAFIADVTNPNQYAKLTSEQKAYRYIISGKSRSYINNSVPQNESDYNVSSDNHLMYGAEASVLSTVDIPLGGDHNPPKLSGKAFTWTPDYHGNLRSKFTNPSPIFIPHSLAGDNIPVAEIASIDTNTGAVTYKSGAEDAAAKINNYLGSFTSDDTFALCVQEQKKAGDSLPDDSEIPDTETVNHSSSGSYQNADYLKAQNGSSTPESGVDMGQSGNEFPEFNLDIGTKLPVAEIGVSDYVTITMNGYEVGFSIGIPLGGYNSNGDAGTGGIGSGGGSGGSGGSGSSTSESNWFGPKKANAANMADMGKMKNFLRNPSMETAKGADDSYANAKDNGKMKSSSFSVDFSVSLAFLFKYNPIDNAFYFSQFSVAIAAELQYKMQYRLTPCPIVYVYVTVGISIEIGTGLSVDRDPKEEPTAALSTETILNPGQTYKFETDYKAFNVTFSGKLGLKSTLPEFKEGYIKSEGDDPVTVTLKKQDGNKLGSKYQVTLVALEKTTIKRVARVVDADSHVYWNGMTISPEAFVEAGAGIGIEIVKFEVFIKISVGCKMTLGAYKKEYDTATGLYSGKYEGFSFDEFDFSLGLGFRVVLLLFSYEMDLIKYSITYDKADGWKHKWSALGDTFGGDIGTLSMTDTNGNTTNAGVRIRLPGSTAATQKIYQPQRDDELTALSYNPTDSNVPFQLSGYGSSGDAFKLADGLLTGYDYKVVTVGKDNYVIYTYGRKGAANEVDNSMLVMSKLRVTSANGKESYGLVNPVNELSATPYILLDTTDGKTDDGTGDLDFNAWADGNNINAAWISYASVSAAAPTILTKPASNVPQLTDGTKMDVTNYKNAGFVPEEPKVVTDPGSKPVEPVQSDYYKSDTDFNKKYSTYEEAKSAYDAALTDYNQYDEKKQAYDDYLVKKKEYDTAKAWYDYFASVDNYNNYIQSRATKAAKNTVIKKASFTVKSSYSGTEGFTASKVISSAPGSTVYVPDSSGDGSAVFYAQAVHYSDSELKKMVSDYTSYLNNSYPGSDASESIRQYRLLYQTGIWETYGKGTQLSASVNGKITSVGISANQTLDNIETKKIGNTYYIAYTTSQQEIQAQDFVTIRRLYIRTATVNSDETVTFQTPYLIKILVDYDRNKGGKDGVYKNASLSKAYSDPYFANLQFLKGKIGQLTGGESIEQLSSDTAENFLLFEMNGSTYIIPEVELNNIVKSGTGTLYPFFTPENMTGDDGSPALQTTTGRAEVTIGADGAGNISAVYTGAVANTGNNALYLSKYDPNTNTWGVGTMLAMRNMQVYEDSISKGWSKDDAQNAYLGKLNGYTGGSMDQLKFSNLQIALGLSADTNTVSTLSDDHNASDTTSSEYKKLSSKFGISKEPTVLSLLGMDDAELIAAGDTPSPTKDTLLVITQASLTKLKEYTVNGEKALGPDGDSTVGIYAVSYGVGTQSIGEDKATFASYDFSAGSELRPTISFVNTGDVSIRGSASNPITVKLNVKTLDNVSTTLNKWKITRNIASGQKVELSGTSAALTKDLPSGSVFYITVEEDGSYSSKAFNATTLSSDGKSGTLVVSPKPELGFEHFSIKSIGIDSNGNAVLNVDFQVGNRGSVTADNAYVQFTYETGKDSSGKLTYSPLDLRIAGTNLTVSKEEVLKLLGASTDTNKQNGILYLYNSSDGGNISKGKGRTVTGTLVVPASCYKGSATGSLNINVEIFSDADTVKSFNTGVLEAVHGEYNSINNIRSTQIEHTTYFNTADRITLAMGNTMRLPVTIATTKETAPVITVTEISNASDNARNLGILYYKDTGNFSKGHTTGTLVITPTKEGTGVIHIKDIATNTTKAITYTVTEYGEGINIYNDNSMFSFKNADGSDYDKASTTIQNWQFKGNIPVWGTGETENEPYLSNLSYGDKNSSFRFTTVAESLDLYFNGSVNVKSTFPGFNSNGIDISASGGSTKARVSFGSNKTNYPHTVTITVTSETAQFDKLVEQFAGDQVPTPSQDDSSPQIYWSRSFPQTASIKSGTSYTVDLTCYVLDDGNLSSVTLNDNVPAGLVKNDNGFWQFKIPVNENGTISVAAIDASGNRTAQSLTVDWFNSTVSQNSVGDAPSVTAKFQVGSQDVQDGKYINQGQTAYLSANAVPGKVSGSPIDDVAANYISSKTDVAANKTTLDISNIDAESDGRFLVSNNGYYQVTATAKDGTWSSTILLMDRMDVNQPTVHLEEISPDKQDAGNTKRSLSWNVAKSSAILSSIKTAAINDYPLSFQQGLTRIAGTFPVTFGGKYTLYAEDMAGNYNNSSITVKDFPIDITSANVFKVSNSWNNDKNNGFITIDSNFITGGLYDASKSVPAANTYRGSYQFAAEKAADASRYADAAKAIAQNNADYTKWLKNLKWQDDPVISDLSPGDYTIYVRDAQDKDNIKVISKKSLTVNDDYITFKTEKTRSTNYAPKDGSITITAAGGKDALGTYQFAILPHTGINPSPVPVSDMESKGAVWEIPDMPLTDLNIKKYKDLTYGHYQVAVRPMAGVSSADLHNLGRLYDDVISAESNVANAEKALTDASINEAVNTYINNISMALQNWNNAAAADKAAAQAEYLAAVNNDATILDMLKLWNEAKEAVQNGTGTQKDLNTAKDNYNNAVKAFAKAQATSDANDKLTKAKAALALSNKALEDQRKQLNDKSDAAFSADPTLWDNANSSMVYVDYYIYRNDTTETEKDKEDDEKKPGTVPVIEYKVEDSWVTVTIPDEIRSIDNESTDKIIGYNSSKNILITGKNLLMQIPKGTLSKGDNLNSMVLLDYQIPAKPQDYVIAYTGKDGKARIIPWSLVSSDGLMYIASSRGTYSVVKNTCTFSDVSADFWGADAVSFAASHELFKGTGKNTFNPDGHMTRGMFVTTLGRLAEIDVKKYPNSFFSDVPSNAWYSPYIGWASENGIISGYSYKVFRPDDIITREQMCTIINRYIKKFGIEFAKTANIENFTDSSKISPWAKEAVNLCHQYGLIKGKNGNLFDPQGKVSRVEAATIYMNMINAGLRKGK